MLLKIKAIRKSRRMSVQELANATGLTSMSIYRYESGVRIPKFDDVLRIAGALGVEVTDLIERKGTR